MAGREAKEGLEEEDRITNALNRFRSTNAGQWLGALNYDVKTIKTLEAGTSRKMGLKNIPADIILTVDNGKPHGIQLKKSRTDVNWNHVHRGPTDKICEEWDAPTFVSNALKKFTGENGIQSEKELKQLQRERKEKGFSEKKIKNLERYKRILLSELKAKERKKVLAWLKKNKKKIVSFVLCGNGRKYRPKHLMVIETTGKVKTRRKRIGIVSMSKAIDHFAEGDVAETKVGTVLMIGKISMKIHGAENTDPNPHHLQFTIKPLGVFDLQSCEIFPKKKPKKTKRGK